VINLVLKEILLSGSDAFAIFIAEDSFWQLYLAH
jgi:hypothetical protein